MKSAKVITAMLDAGFLKPDLDNPIDFTLFSARAVEQLNEALKGCKAADELTDIIASMFDNGYCNRDDQPDPAEWISYAVQAVKALRAGAND